MNIKSVIISAVLLVLATFSGVKAAEQRIYPCHRLASEPDLEKGMEDVAWKNIPEAEGFYIHGGSGKYAVEKQTSFKAGWTEEALYLIIAAEETTPEKLLARGTDASSLWTDDSMELFLFPNGAATYTHLIVNTTGKRYNGRGGILPLMEWDARSRVGKTEWTLALRIPFKVLTGAVPKEGDEWPVNIGRNIFTGPSAERNTCWPLLQKGFHDVKNYGYFVFKGTAGGKIGEEEKELNHDYAQYMIADIRKLAAKAGKYKNELAEVQMVASQSAEAVKLQQIWDHAVKLATQPEPDIKELVSWTRDCVNLPRRSRDCVARTKLEILMKE